MKWIWEFISVHLCAISLPSIFLFSYPIFVDGCDRMTFRMDWTPDTRICRYHSFEFGRWRILKWRARSPGWRWWRTGRAPPPAPRPPAPAATWWRWDRLRWLDTPEWPPWPGEQTSLRHPPSWTGAGLKWDGLSNKLGKLNILCNHFWFIIILQRFWENGKEYRGLDKCFYECNPQMQNW